MAASSKTRDTVTALLNYDVSSRNDDDNDPFREIDTTLYDPADRLNSTKRKASGTDDKENSTIDLLGLDEEVKIVKKRKPVAKLDDARLLSQAGIPKLRALARSKSTASKLRLKGKGHEFSDAAKLLSYYQLWLDNLYPRANFADGLRLVEKVGHGKKMQTMRREWIDEGKPGYGKDTEEKSDVAGTDVFKNDRAVPPTDTNLQQPGKDKMKAAEKTKAHEPIFGDLDEGDSNDLFFADASGSLNPDHGYANEPDEDELDALLAEQNITSNQPRPTRDRPEANDDEEDDLDALLAEQSAATNKPQPAPKQPDANNDEEDELDAVLAEQNITSNTTKSVQTQPHSNDDDLDVLLAEQETASQR